MTTIQVVSGVFDQWLAGLWQDLRNGLRRKSALVREQQRRRDAVGALRERIAQYAHQHPGYAADLRAALACLEADAERR